MRYFEPYTEFRSCPSKIPLKTPRGKEVFVEIGPGSSFGAGHQTTRLCIRGIEEIFKTRRIKTVLDLGCGSGILGISCAMLGAESVLAIDIDPVAIEESKRNVETNGVGSKVQILYGSLDNVREKFDLVLANVITDELLRMRGEIKLAVKEDGILLVSGISELKKEYALSGFREIGFSPKREFTEGGWVAIWFNLESEKA